GLVCELGVCVTPGSGVDAPQPNDDAGIDAAPDAPPDAEIDAGLCIAACAGENLVCGEQVTPCALGCSETGGAHCAELVPSNGLVFPPGNSGIAMLSLDGSVRIDTSTGEIRDVGANTTIRAP